ncbi:hypothetical protein [Streptomyces sp. NPDC001665]
MGADETTKVSLTDVRVCGSLFAVLLLVGVSVVIILVRPLWLEMLVRPAPAPYLLVPGLLTCVTVVLKASQRTRICLFRYRRV